MARQEQDVAALLVDSQLDVVNGDVSGPAPLARQPGADGISLREAIEAANRAGGPVAIHISPALSGQTIVPESPFFLRQTGIQVLGPRDRDGRPTVTLDAAVFRGGPGIDDRALIMVLASDVTVAGLRIVGLPSRRTAISVQAGAQPLVIAPQLIERIRIEDNEFDNTGSEVRDFGFAIQLSMGTRDTAADATIANVLVARNSFRNYLPHGNGLNIGSRGVHNTIRDVVVENNQFDRVRFPVELATNPGRQNHILGTRVVSNRFVNGGVAVWAGNIGNDQRVPATGNTVEDTLIWGNLFSANIEAPIALNAGLGNVSGSVVRDTRIVNNVMTSGPGGMFFTGGSGADATNNEVSAVRIVNNTFVRHRESAIGVVVDASGATANRVMDVTVTNTILQGPDRDFNGLPTSQVSYSMTSTRTLDGVNGNFSADPRFIDEANGDLRLREGSPAINRGTANGAPETDFDCRRRVGRPDIGAFEFAGAPAACGR